MSNTEFTKVIITILIEMGVEVESMAMGDSMIAITLGESVPYMTKTSFRDAAARMDQVDSVVLNACTLIIIMKDYDAD